MDRIQPTGNTLLYTPNMVDRIQVPPCSIPPSGWTGYRYYPALYLHQGGQDTGNTLLYNPIRVDSIQVLPCSVNPIRVDSIQVLPCSIPPSGWTGYIQVQPCSIPPSGWTGYSYYPALYPHQGGQVELTEQTPTC